MTFRLPETGLPGLSPLLDGSLWNTWVSEDRVFPLSDVRSAIRYVRLKPGVSCRLTIFADDQGRGSEPPPGMLVHLYPDAGRARGAFQKESRRRHFLASGGHTPFLIEDPPILVLPFPNDPDIPDLRHVYEPERFRRTLASVLPEFPTDAWRIQRQLIQTRMLAYKPGRRAVFRIKTKLRRLQGDEKVRVFLHAKLETPRTVERSHRNLLRIWEARPRDGCWTVPRPRGYVPARSFVAAEWVEGESLLGRFHGGGDSLDEACAATGRALARFHTLELGLEHQPSPVEESEKLLEYAADLARLLPEESTWIHILGERIAGELSRLSTSPSCITHGDFHLGQVITGNGPPCFVDLDGAGRGYAAHDLGSFLAHLHEIGAPRELSGAFLNAYEDVTEQPIDPPLIQITTTAALFRRAIFPFRRLEEEWPDTIRDRLNAVEDLLTGISS